MVPVSPAGLFLGWLQEQQQSRIRYSQDWCGTHTGRIDRTPSQQSLLGRLRRIESIDTTNNIHRPSRRRRMLL